MKKLILSLMLVVGIVISTSAQNAKGDWYVGTGNIADVAWTDWAVFSGFTPRHVCGSDPGNFKELGIWGLLGLLESYQFSFAQ